MDPVAHTLVGGTLAAAGLRRRSPLATTTLLLAANAPDIDIVTMSAGGYASLALRRGWTHGVLALAVLPVLTAGLVLAYDRFIRRRRDPDAPPADPRVLLALAALGILTHPALDWLNTYGVRLLAPFSMDWFYGDALFIIDPWLWLILGGALVAGRFMRHRTERLARAALVAATAYILLMVGASLAAESIIRRELDGEFRTVMFQPAPANPFAGTFVAESDSVYRLGRFGWLSAPRVQPADTIAKHRDPVIMTAAATHPDAMDFLVWSRFPYFRAVTAGDALTVIVGDARYADEPRAGMLQGVTVTVRR